MLKGILTENNFRLIFVVFVDVTVFNLRGFFLENYRSTANFFLSLDLLNIFANFHQLPITFVKNLIIVVKIKFS